MRAYVLLLVVVVTACGEESFSSPTVNDWPVLKAYSASVATPAERAVILERIASADKLEVMWGAYLAGRLGVVEASPSLVSALDRFRGRRTRNYVLDALALLGAEAPQNALTTHDAASLAIALNEPAVHADFLRDAWLLYVSDLGYAPRYRALANALLSVRDAAFVYELLKRLSAQVRIDVTSSDDQWVSGRGGSYRSNCGIALFIDEEVAYPPVPTWTFVDADHTHHEDARALVRSFPGPRPGWLERTEFGSDALMAVARRPGRMRDAVSRRALDDIDAARLDPDALELEEEDVSDELGTFSVIETSSGLRAVGDEGPECDDTSSLADFVAMQTSDAMLEVTTYLGFLLERDAATLFPDMVDVDHRWQGLSAYVSSVRSVRDDIAAIYSDIAGALKVRGLLPDGSEPPPVAVYIWTTDYRLCDRAIHLPRPEDL